MAARSSYTRSLARRKSSDSILCSPTDSHLVTSLIDVHVECNNMKRRRRTAVRTQLSERCRVPNDTHQPPEGTPSVVDSAAEPVAVARVARFPFRPGRPLVGCGYLAWWISVTETPSHLPPFDTQNTKHMISCRCRIHRRDVLEQACSGCSALGFSGLCW